MNYIFIVSDGIKSDSQSTNRFIIHLLSCRMSFSFRLLLRVGACGLFKPKRTVLRFELCWPYGIECKMALVSSHLCNFISLPYRNKAAACGSPL